MGPDFTRDQIASLCRALAENAKHITDKTLRIEDAFLDPGLVIHQVNALREAVSDSVVLYGNHGNDHQFVVTKADFSLKQAENLQVAIHDNVRLQSCSHGDLTKLSTMSPAFILDIVKALESVVCDNASVAMERNVDRNSLNMSKPQFVANLLWWFHRLIHDQVILLKEITSWQDARVNAETALAQSRQENEQLTAAQQTSHARIAELEATLNTLQQENRDVKQIADVADGAAQARIEKVLSELGLLHSTHSNCESKLQERDAELAKLMEEHKRLIKSCQEQAEAAAEGACKLTSKSDELQQLEQERDRLVVELSEARQLHEAFCLSRAQEHDQMISENIQLQSKVGRLEMELLTAQTDLASAEIQADTWKTTVDSKNTELDEMRQVAAHETEEREAADGLLRDAVRKIEELENKLRDKETEMSRFHNSSTFQNGNRAQRLLASPPPSAHKPSGPSTKKRKSLGGDRAKAAASWSEGDQGWWLNLAAHQSPLPDDRAGELASLPEVVVDLGPDSVVPAIFTRQSLSNILGGSIQGLVVRCTNSATDLAQKHDIQDYLCPNMDHNAWSPAEPGKHGYMQVGLGRDRKLFNDQGEYRHVFVGTNKFFLYCGWYHVCRVDALTVDEWSTLPPKVQTTYSETTKNKEKKLDKSAEQVLAMYNSGELRAPCVRLQCVGFDTAFYQELARANDQFFAHKPRPGPPPATNKRRKVAGDEAKDEEAKDEEDDKDENSIPASGSSNEGVSTSLLPLPLTEISSTATSAPSSLQNCATHLSATPVPAASASVTLTPSLPQTRSTSQWQLRLRIPGRRSMQTMPERTETVEELKNELSSDSDDDDMYAD